MGGAGAVLRTFVLVLAAALALMAAAPALAATFTVDSTADQGDFDPGDGLCSAADESCTLRAAVEETTALDGDDTINVPAGTYVLTIGSDLEIRDNDNAVTIVGTAGAGSTIVDGDDEQHIFDVWNRATATIVGLTIEEGNTSQEENRNGGCISNSGTLTVASSVIRSCEGRWGGAIYNAFGALLFISDTFVSENFADEGGGIYNASLGPEPQTGADPPGMTIAGSTIDDNRANYDTGGGIYNYGEASIATSSILANETSGPRGGGGIFNGGGSVYPSTLALSMSVVEGNIVDNGNGGGISNEAGSFVYITDTTIADNWAEYGGAGFYNAGAAAVLRSTFDGNGTYELPEQPVRRTGTGGAIMNLSSVVFLGPTFAAPTLFVENSTISGNTAASGGGVYQTGGFEITPGELPIPRAHFNHVTIANNVAYDGSGGGIFVDPFMLTEVSAIKPDVRLRNTILSANNAEDLPNPNGPAVFALAVSNCGGEDPDSDGNNLESADTCGLNLTTGDGDLVNTEPKLGLLAANGGPTRTHELAADSPALNAAEGSQSCPSTDQRGTTRPQGTGCDIGAYERLFQAPPPPPPPPPPTPPPPPPPPPPPAPPPAPQPQPVPRTPRAVPRCTVPNVKGKTVNQAKRAITRAGCRASVMGRRFSASLAPGRVIGQSVLPGARVRRGTLVRLIMSRGQRPVRPPFTG